MVHPVRYYAIEDPDGVWRGGAQLVDGRRHGLVVERCEAGDIVSVWRHGVLISRDTLAPSGAADREHEPAKHS